MKIKLMVLGGIFVLLAAAALIFTMALVIEGEYIQESEGGHKAIITIDDLTHISTDTIIELPPKINKVDLLLNGDNVLKPKLAQVKVYDDINVSALLDDIDKLPSGQNMAETLSYLVKTKQIDSKFLTEPKALKKLTKALGQEITNTEVVSNYGNGVLIETMFVVGDTAYHHWIRSSCPLLNLYILDTTGCDYIRDYSTRVGICNIVSLSGDDHIHGNQSSYLVFSDYGDKFIKGGIKKDKLYGGRGNDTILSGGGNNGETKGHDGNDTVVGGEGSDAIWGGEGNDHLYGGPGIDYINGEAGNNYIEAEQD